MFSNAQQQYYSNNTTRRSSPTIQPKAIQQPVHRIRQQPRSNSVVNQLDTDAFQQLHYSPSPTASLSPPSPPSPSPSLPPPSYLPTATSTASTTSTTSTTPPTHRSFQHDLQDIARSLLQPSEHNVILSQTVSSLAKHISDQHKYNNEMLTYYRQLSSSNLNTLNKQYTLFAAQEQQAREGIRRLCVRELQKADVITKSVFSKVQSDQYTLRQNVKELKDSCVVSNEQTDLHVKQLHKELDEGRTNLAEVTTSLEAAVQQVLMKHEQQVHETMRRKKDTHEQVNALNEHVKLLQHQNGVQKNEMVHLKKMVTRLEGRLDEIQRGGYDW